MAGDDFPDEIYDFPGIFPVGSEQDQNLVAHHRSQAAADAPLTRAFTYTNELVTAGILGGAFVSSRTMPLTKEMLGSEAAAAFVDQRAMVLIDARLRWSRMLLGENDVDDTLMHAPRHSPLWYAAKTLAHYRRAEAIDIAINALGYAREWMLFGETWAEAKFATNHGKDAIRGKNTVKSAREGGDARRGKIGPHTNAVLAEMTRIITQQNTPNIDSAAAAAASNGVGKSPGANARLWYRHKGRKV